MPDSSLDVRSQLNQLLRTLDSLKEGNLALQQRLAEEVVRAEGRKDELETLEGFLDSFLNKDLHISLLRKDVRAQELRAANGTANNGASGLRLQHDVKRMSEEFERLKASFEARFRLRA